MRIGILISLALIAVLAFAGAALAHCGTCGVGDAAHPEACGCETCSAHPADGHPADCDCEGCSAHAAHGGDKAHAAITACPGCGMDGGLCAHCETGADAVLRDLAVGFCPNCFEPDALCDLCSVGVADAVDRLGSLSAAVMNAPEHSMAYLEGTLYGDMEALFGEMIQAAGQQGLMNAETHVGSVIPFGMAEGFNPDSVYYAGVSLPAGSEPQAPLSVFTVPAGAYLVFDHVGPYEQLVHSWLAAFAFAEMSGLELGTGAAGEHYVSDPGTTPQDELLTQIFIPIVGHGDASHHGM